MSKPVLLTCVLIIAAPCGLWALGNNAKNRARAAREAREARAVKSLENERKRQAAAADRLSADKWQAALNEAKGDSYWVPTDDYREAKERREVFLRVCVERGLVRLLGGVDNELFRNEAVTPWAEAWGEQVVRGGYVDDYQLFTRGDNWVRELRNRENR